MVCGDAKEGESKRVLFISRNLMPTLSDEVFETFVKHVEPPPSRPPPRSLRSSASILLRNKKLAFCCYPRRGEGDHGTGRKSKKRLREVAAPYVTDAPVHRNGQQQQSPKRRREMEGGLSFFVLFCRLSKKDVRTTGGRYTQVERGGN